jgi:hypothetical protein
MASLTLIFLFKFYEWCQKSLQMQLGKTGDASVIKIYSRIIRIEGAPLVKIREAARELVFIKY